MKITKNIQYWRMALAGFMLTAFVGPSRADVPVFQITFDNTNAFVTSVGFPNYGTYGLDNPTPSLAVPNVRFDYGGSTTTGHTTIAWSTNDAAGQTNSGSIQFTIPMDVETDDGGTQGAFTFDFYENGGAATNLTSISFDVMVDPSSTPENTNNVAGGYGFLQFVSRDNNYGFVVIPTFGEDVGAVYTGTVAGHWQHVVAALDSTDNTIRGITMQLYGGPGQNINGTVILYIDNLTVSVAGAIPQPTMSIGPTGPKGLVVGTSTNVTINSGQPQFQRQGLRALNTTNYNWVGSANPITYALTIAHYPGPTNAGFETHIWLNQGATTDLGPDFADPTLAELEITGQGDGTAVGAFRYKVNDSDDVSMLETTGFLGTVTNPTPVGTWSVTLNGDNVTVMAPGGATLNTNMASGDSGNFAGPLTVYIGCIPGTNGVGLNNGQAVVFSRFEIISNSVALLNDGFTTPLVDTTLWAFSSEDPQALLQVPPTAALLLDWDLPDTGFRLTANTDLTTTNWQNFALPVSIYNGKRTGLIPASALSTNEFFRLVNP